MRAAAQSQPVFSCQQQYTLLDPQSHYPVGATPFPVESEGRVIGSKPTSLQSDARRDHSNCASQWRVIHAGWPERAGEGVSCSQSYGAVGSGTAVGREFAETHVRACLHAGLRMAGMQSALSLLIHELHNAKRPRVS